MKALRRLLGEPSRSARRLKAERGFALVMALGLLAVMTIVGTTATYYATTNLVGSNTHKARASAYDLAEAGINAALSKMAAQLDNNPNSWTYGAVVPGGVSPKSSALFPSTPGTATVVQYPDQHGSVAYYGTLDTSGDPYVWTIYSTGKAKNGQSYQARTLVRKVNVNGTGNGNQNSWSRFYQDSTASCLTIDTATITTNFATRGDLCLTNGGQITGANTVVDVGGNVIITGPDATGGPKSPSAGTGWTSPTNVYSQNSVYATNVIAAGATGANEDATGYGFAIPATATIEGISATVWRMSSACCNAVQTITTNGSPTGGTFKLNATPAGGGSTVSASIAYNASAATIQTALVTIFGSGNVTCTGGSLPTAVVCTFANTDGNQPITLMTLNSKTSWVGGTSPYVTIANTTVGSVGALVDNTVQLLKAGAAVGTNKAAAGNWGFTNASVNYGSTADMWGTTWTPADINAANFGLRFQAKNVAAASATASLDYVSITVTYKPDTNGIGTSGTPIKTADVSGTCKYLLQAAHTPCTATDHVWAGTITSPASGTNPALTMPKVDFTYWWANAMPGPKHPCTTSTGTPPTFDTDAATTSAPNASIPVNGEMTPNNADYTCQVTVNGVLKGELDWNHTTHVMTIFGTIFIDGNFRFDDDGEVVHYQGRATIYAGGHDEIDEVVCSGGSGTGWTPSCLQDMSNWDPSTNLMVLMSQEDNEYDQGGTSCAGNTPPTCYNGHLAGAFQGILYSTADCLIHQNFQDSGPVICNTITLPNEGGVNPTYYTFPYLGNLTDGQSYGSVVTSSNFKLTPITQTGG